MSDELQEQIEQLQQKLVDHIDECDERFKSGDLKFDLMITKQQEILDCSRENTRALKEINDNTEEVVAFYNEGKDVVHASVKLQRFLLWLAKWGVVGTALVAFTRWALKFIEHI